MTPAKRDQAAAVVEEAMVQLVVYARGWYGRLGTCQLTQCWTWRRSYSSDNGIYKMGIGILELREPQVFYISHVKENTSIAMLD
jgi:hypothetical protein